MADVENDNNNKSASLTFVKFMFFAQGLCLSFGQSDPPYVAVVRNSVATKNTFTVIEVYRGTGDVEFDKAKYLVAEEALKFDDNLPKESVINTTMEPATLLLPATLTPADRSGIYTITVTRNGESETIWRALVTNEDATTRAVEYSTVASRGDAVTVTVETDITPQTDIHWRRDGLLNPLNGGERCLLSCGDDNATAGSNVVFECFRVGRYLSQMHAIMNVVVRECEHNKWGPPGCMNDCQPCINGGICSDLTGWCLCPPGFSGYHCENVHGSNVFGQNAEYRCDDSSDDHSNGCQGALICYPNPFGCTCPAGYTGFDCMETCERGKFGANCKQECHCKDQCASDTGVCEDGECEDGWYGVNCQLTEMPVDCRPGLYGDFCSNPCSCETEDCSDVEANCAAGCAVPWTGSACNQNTGDGIINLSYDKVNAGQVTAMRCSVIRNPPISEGDLILSLAGTPCTDCDNQNSDRSYNLTRTVMLPLSTSVEVTCSVRNTNLMETTMLVPFVLPAYASSDVLTFHDVTSTSITVRWSPWNDMNDFGDGPVIDYRIQIRENGTEVFSNESKETDLVHQFLDLTPDTLYEFRIILVREGQGGEGAPSNVQRQRTLCDGPSEPPMNIQLVRSSATELEFSWNPPRCQSQNGISYSYQLQSQDTKIVTEGTTSSLGVVIEDLIPGTEYSFLVSTSKGPGPFSDAIIARTEDIPGPPRNVIVTDRSETSLTIEWSMPVNLTGSIIHYQLQFRAIEKLYDQQFALGEFGQSINVSTQGESNIHVLNGLEPSTLYEIKLFAATSAGRGDDVSVRERTDVFTGLQPLTTLPEIDLKGTTATLTLPALNQQYALAYYIRVQAVNSADKKRRDIDGFGNFNQNPDHYIAAEVEKNEQEMEFTIGDGEMYGGYFNAPLQEETNYNAFIGIGSKAGEDVFVTWSDSIAFGPSSDFPVVIVAVVVAVVVVLTLLCLGGLICRRRSSKPQTVQKYPELGEKVVNPAYNNASSSSEEKLSETNEEEKPSYISEHDETSSQQPVSSHVIKISDLAAYVREKKGNSEDNFSTEFETLPTDPLYPWTVGEKPENKMKNRYGNIVPYDNSRVVLEIVEGDPHSDYINASYIDGYKSPKKFIASHGPNQASVIDFWRMVWQEDVARIVMLTPLFEGEKPKCLEYWPEEEKVFGELFVRCHKLEKHSKYSQRTFYVTLKHGSESKLVEHFHFTNWKDMKVPEFLDPTLEFLRIVRKDYSGRGGCTIVHCSAGAGRTGTYITLDAMLDMGQAEQQINVYEFVQQMRHTRFQSVQVKGQYEFIFDTLVKHFCIGRTSMSVESFRSDLSGLQQVNSATGNTFIMDQYKKLEETTRVAASSEVLEGKKEENKDKNRSSNMLPVETHRPILMTQIKDDESNYINATFLDGYKQRYFFIATQMPLEKTIVDFWRLLWDYNCSVIVMLNSLENKNEQYWPDSSPVTFAPFTVVPLSSDYHGNICVRKVEVRNATLQKKRTIHQMQCIIDRPNQEFAATESSETLINCTHLLKKFCSESKVNRVLVHCIDGVGWTGVFCALVAALDQARTEQEVDIFQHVANMRKAQPLMIQNFEQYQCIFDFVLSDLESDGNAYQNV